MLAVVKAEAQQELLFSNDRYNILSFNPGQAGVFENEKTNVSASVAYRNQWLGFKGAPVTINGAFDFLLAEEKIGLGLTLLNDRIGIDSRIEIAGNYSYQVKTRDGVFSGGIRTAYTRISSDFSKVHNADVGDIYDNVNESISVFSVGIGFIYLEENLSIGLSVPNITAFSSSSRIKEFKRQHLYANVSVKLGDYTNEIRIEPSVLFKYQPSVPLQAKIGVYAYFNEILTPGLHYRSDDALAFSCGVNFNEQYNIAIAYDLTLSKLKEVSNNTIELFLCYRY